MNTLNYLGLDEKKVANVVNGLSQLLADLQVFYSNLRGFHWNVKGKGFFTLHAKYEELYSEYLKVARVKEEGNDPECGREGMMKVLDTLALLIGQERKLVELAGEANDEVTTALMDDYLKSQEKTVWMLAAFLSKKPE